MYFNLKYLEEKGLVFTDLFVLQLAKQQKSENCEDYLDACKKEVILLEKTGLLKRIKGKKGESEMSKIRLTKEGLKILDAVEIAEISEDDITLFEWIKGIYLNMDKTLGNQKKTKLYIALFRANSGIDLNKLAVLMSDFTNDVSNMKYNNVLEFALFRSSNAYNTRFSLEESRVYQYYLNHQEYFDKKFEEL